VPRHADRLICVGARSASAATSSAAWEHAPSLIPRQPTADHAVRLPPLLVPSRPRTAACASSGRRRAERAPVLASMSARVCWHERATDTGAPQLLTRSRRTGSFPPSTSGISGSTLLRRRRRDPVGVTPNAAHCPRRAHTHTAQRAAHAPDVTSSSRKSRGTPQSRIPHLQNGYGRSAILQNRKCNLGRAGSALNPPPPVPLCHSRHPSRAVTHADRILTCRAAGCRGCLTSARGGMEVEFSGCAAVATWTEYWYPLACSRAGMQRAGTARTAPESRANE
jgi:hypothetical protein